MFSKPPLLPLHLRNQIWRPVILFFFFVLVVLISNSRILDPYENIFLDLRFKSRPIQPFSDKIVLIELSDDSIQQLGFWPIPRDFHASLIDVLKQSGVRQVMFDLIFTDASQEDDKFYTSIKNAGNVYLPFVLQPDEEKKSNAFVSAQNIVAPLLPRFTSVIAGSGHINSFKDSDGKTRWSPLFIQFQGKNYPQITLRMACDYLGIPFEPISYSGGFISIGNKLKIPTLPNGSMLVNYAGRWQDTFRHYSYVDILAAWQEAQNGEKPRIDLNSLKDSVCFVGLTATGTPDLQAIPFQNNYPLVGLHANVLNSILLDRYIHRAGRTINCIILFVFLLIVLATHFLKKNQPIIALAATVFYSAVFAAVAFGVFIFFGIWIDLFYPLMVTGLAYIGVTIYDLFQEGKKRELLEKELSIAKTIQESFLPLPIEKFHSAQIAAHMTPAKHVGGDFYDMRVLENERIGVLIGDVSGKGVGAALVMAEAISLFRMLVHQIEEPSSLLTRLNEEIVKDSKSNVFITAVYLVFDPRSKKISMSSAGHVAPILFQGAENKIHKVEFSGGMPLGLMSGAEFSQEEVILGKGDEIVLCTDGVLEARNPKKEEFGEERLFSILKKTRLQAAKDVLRAIEGEIKIFAGKARYHDDFTLVVLKEGDG
ncbi:MAG: CHASE2 domain-containing protein [Candidatus Omnitrophota bacterium]